MVRFILLFIFLSSYTPFHAFGQSLKIIDSTRKPAVKGYHIGIVQPLLAFNKNKSTYFTDYDFYSIGFPFGITLTTSGSVLIDLELVPFIKPRIDDDAVPYEVHLLYHPGILIPVGHGFTVGLRAAFEPGNDQFGFTPLVNKGFSLNKGMQFFVELVLPGRFGPEKSSGYTQVAGFHMGVGF